MPPDLIFRRVETVGLPTFLYERPIIRADRTHASRNHTARAHNFFIFIFAVAYKASFMLVC
jgi:hypothetical protein